MKLSSVITFTSMSAYAFVIIAISWSLILAGCGTSSATDDASVSTNEQTKDKFNNKRPQRPADIVGTVKQAVGNEFSIETINASWNALLSMSQEEMRTKMQSLSWDQRTAFFQELQQAREQAPKYTVEVLVPAGIPIAVSSRWWFGWWAWFWWGGFWAGGWGFWWWGRGNWNGWASAAGWQQWWAGLAGIMWQAWWWQNQQQNRQAWGTAQLPSTWSLSDIKVGSTVTIWLMTGNDDRKIAEWVMVQWTLWQWNNGQFGGQFGGAQGRWWQGQWGAQGFWGATNPSAPTR